MNMSKSWDIQDKYCDKYRYRAGSEAATEQKQREKETKHGKSNKN